MKAFTLCVRNSHITLLFAGVMKYLQRKQQRGHRPNVLFLQTNNKCTVRVTGKTSLETDLHMQDLELRWVGLFRKRYKRMNAFWSTA